MSKFTDLLKEKILILDGAMGTMFQKQNLTEEDFRGEIFKNSKVNLKGNNDVLALTKPDALKIVHRAYLEAGADIIETNTFSSTKISQKDYHLENYIEELNTASIKVARKIAEEVLCLPLYYSLSLEEIEYIINCIEKIVKIKGK